MPSTARSQPEHSKRLARVFVLVSPVWLLAIVSFCGVSPVSAHSPHDVVDDVQFVGSESPSDTAFALIRGRLMRSSDRGETWSEIVNGLSGDSDPVKMFAFAGIDPEFGYLASMAGIVFRTVDGGSNWSTVGAVDQRVSRLEVSPTVPELVLAVGLHVSLRSVDGGQTWQLIKSGRHPIVDAGFSLDGRRVIGVDAAGRAVASTDGGASWSVTADLDLLGSPRVLTLVRRPYAPPVVFVGGTEGELMRSDDGGAAFVRVGDGLPLREIRSIAVSEVDASLPDLWLTTWTTGPFRSTDLGETWTEWGVGTTTNDQAAAQRQPDWNVITPVPDASGKVLLGGFDGLFALGGAADREWRQIETLDRYVVGLAVSPGFARDRVVVVTSYVRGAFRSSDGGDTWEPINRGLEFADNPSSSFPVWRLHNVRMSPDYEADQTLFSSTWLEVTRSLDGGRSWERIDIPRAPDGSRRRLFVIGVSPDFDTDETVFAGTREGAIYRSVAGGDPGTWEQLSILPERVRSIAIAPAIGDDQTLLLGTERDVYRSIDGGTTWERVAVGIADVPTHGIQVSMSPEFATDGTALAAGAGGLFLSSDGGSSWNPSTGIETGAVEAAAFSPDYRDDGIILTSVRGHGLRRSTDGGASFEPVGNDLAAANLLIADYTIPTSNPIQFSPSFATDRTVFAYAEQEVLRSTDGGETWDVLELPASADVRATLLDEQDLDSDGDGMMAAGFAVVVILGLVLAGRRWNNTR